MVNGQNLCYSNLCSILFGFLFILFFAFSRAFSSSAFIITSNLVEWRVWNSQFRVHFADMEILKCLPFEWITHHLCHQIWRIHQLTFKHIQSNDWFEENFGFSVNNLAQRIYSFCYVIRLMFENNQYYRPIWLEFFVSYQRILLNLSDVFRRHTTKKLLQKYFKIDLFWNQIGVMKKVEQIEHKRK